MDSYAIDPANLGPLWSYLSDKLKGGTSYFYVRLGMILTRATLKYHGASWARGREYNDLLVELNRKVRVPKAYPDDGIRRLLAFHEADCPVTRGSADLCSCGALKTDNHSGLYHAIILMSFAGLRISACQGLKFSDFQEMPGGVHTFIVNSKGKRYVAGICSNAFAWMKKTNYSSSPLVVPFDEGAKVRFDNHFRHLMTKVMINGAADDLKADRVVFHSCRKWFSDKALESGLLDEERQILMGHSFKSLTWAHYTTQDGLSMKKRVAEIYTKTNLSKIFDEMMRNPSETKPVQQVAQ